MPRSRLAAPAALLSLYLGLTGGLSCSHARHYPADGIFSCYRDIQWYSWERPYNGAEAIVLGPKQRDGNDAQFVLLAGSRGKGPEARNGLYLFTAETAYFYEFPALIEPERDYVFRLDFESDDGDLRKLWVKYSEKRGAGPIFEVYSGWQLDLRNLRLASAPATDAEAEAVLASETARFIRGMRSTYDRQKALLPAPPRDGKDRGDSLSASFQARLRQCAAVDNPLIREAARAELGKFAARR